MLHNTKKMPNLDILQDFLLTHNIKNFKDEKKGFIVERVYDILIAKKLIIDPDHGNIEAAVDRTIATRNARQAEEEFKSRILLPQSLLRTVKMIIILALLTFIYVAWLCGHKPTACMNTILTSATTEPRFLYLLYFMTTYFHLFAIVLMFSYFSRGTVIFLSFIYFRWL